MYHLIILKYILFNFLFLLLPIICGDQIEWPRKYSSIFLYLLLRFFLQGNCKLSLFFLQFPHTHPCKASKQIYTITITSKASFITLYCDYSLFFTITLYYTNFSLPTPHVSIFRTSKSSVCRIRTNFSRGKIGFLRGWRDTWGQEWQKYPYQSGRNLS
jgi:hypothetical protein